MEILQTIWNALTTENAMLITILSIPLTFIEISVTILLSTAIINITPSRKQKLIAILILSLTGIITNLFIPSPFNTFINILVFPITIMFTFKVNFLKSLIAEIIPYIFTFIILYILMNIYSAISKLSITQFSCIPLCKIIFSLITYILIYLLYKICKKFNFNITFLDKMKLSNNIILIINFVIAIIAISINLYTYIIYSKTVSNSIFLFSIISLIIYFAVSLFSLSRTTKLEETTRDLEGEKLVNKSLTILHDNIRAFKHDFGNIVQAIGGYVTTNDLDGLKKYYSQLFDDCQRVNNLTTLSPEVINNPAIYSLLASKYHKADELGIKIDLKVFVDLNTLKIKVYELTRILGILLDNAIEATMECDNKFIDLEIIKDEAHRRNSIIIKNTYLDKDVNIDRIFEKSYSTKPNNTGLGLWEVRQILKKNNNLDLFTTKNDEFFIQQFEIYFKPIK